VILSAGTELRSSLAGLERKVETAGAAASTLEQAERQHILKVLGETNWVIGGPHGAAARLGVKRTTLLSRIERLGISRPSQ